MWSGCGARVSRGRCSRSRPGARSATRSTVGRRLRRVSRRSCCGRHGRSVWSRCSRRDRGGSPRCASSRRRGVRRVLVGRQHRCAAPRRSPSSSCVGRGRVRAVGAGRAGRGQRAGLRRRAPLPAAHPARRCSSVRSRSPSRSSVAGVSVGPLLLADGRYVAGALADARRRRDRGRARPVAALARRPVARARSGRASWSPIRSTLADPVLMRREQIAERAANARMRDSSSRRARPPARHARRARSRSSPPRAAVVRPPPRPPRRGAARAEVRARRRPSAPTPLGAKPRANAGSHRLSCELARRRCRRRAPRRRRSSATTWPGRDARLRRRRTRTVSPSRRAANGAPCARVCTSIVGRRRARDRRDVAELHAIAQAARRADRP